MDEFLKTLLITFLSNFVLCGVILSVTMRYINETLDTKDSKSETAKLKRIEKARLDSQWREAADKLFYWIVKILTKGDDTTNLNKAWERLNEVEQGYEKHNESIVLMHEEELRR